MSTRITYSLFENPSDDTGKPHGDLLANGSNKNFLRGSLRLFFVSSLMNAAVLMPDIRLPTETSMNFLFIWVFMRVPKQCWAWRMRPCRSQEWDFCSPEWGQNLLDMCPTHCT